LDVGSVHADSLRSGVFCSKRRFSGFFIARCFSPTVADDLAFERAGKISMLAAQSVTNTLF
jgi:hypothetical protein